jgi:hypothetical protein
MSLRGGGMRKTKQEMEMTEQGIVVEHENGYTGKEE